ncbi:DNA-binding protein [Aeromicrobium sp. A1-2]|uniref:helix-hairpin-helix domain-containing protein n=1 Tax=Aeromicrobium sp. A1-2 TaxID=2107713 RepID=UPI000E4DA570|nr:helix-hairpin-helix domain-containing protein [Aeromicrobium sp. A1-2]AXT84520.1 DNA-binding protein [Aeromicrobium sp. A1-2]
MRSRRPDQPDETRAEIARRRLAQLAASFDAELPPVEEPEPTQTRRAVELPHVRVLATIAVAASVLLVWWLLSARPETSDPVAPLVFGESTAPTGGATTGPAAGDLIIDVVGKVRKPGIVKVPSGSRVYQAIEAAGGLKGRVNTTSLNLARVLGDGEQVLVGIEPVVVPGAGGGVASATVNLNTATAEQLETLPGIGPVTAQAILDWRQKNGRFGSVEDLLDVRGIGDATLAELRDHVTV